jgi:hypothetical protein
MPAQAGIQYSGTPAMESRTRGVLDTPPSRSMTVVEGASSSTPLRGALATTCPPESWREQSQTFLVVLDCVAIAHYDDVETLTGKMAQSGIFAAAR